MNHTFTLYDPSIMTGTPAQQAMTDRLNGVFEPLVISSESFQKAYDTPEIGPYIQKDYKGLSYLSWPFAFLYLNQHFPGVFVAFEQKDFGNELFGSEGAYYLRPYLTDGIRRTPALLFPVMDRRHNSLKEEDARAVADNHQRAAVKCIATYTGLGLRLYAGEDIPKEEEQKQASKPAGAAKKAAPSAPAATGGTSSDAFDGKAALMSFCSANPLEYGDEKACQFAIKGALETLGLARGSDVKNCADFTNVVSTLMASWTKDNGIKITKADMAQELAKITAEAKNGVDAVNNAVAAFYAAKK